jgi:hypothetical protein
VQQTLADIDSAVTVNAVNYIREQWNGIAAYALKVKNKQVEADAREIEKRAERKIGKIIKAQKETFGLAKAGRPKIGLLENPISEPKPLTLAEVGIDKNLANRARKEAAKSEEQFEADVAETKTIILAGGRKPKTVNAKPLPDIVDGCVAVVCKRIDDTIVEIQHRHKHEARRMIERLSAALADALIDRTNKALASADGTDVSAAERKAYYAAIGDAP